jgi:hypothetical protein
MIVRTGIFSISCTDKRQMFDPSHIRWAGSMQKTIGVRLRVKRNEITVFEHQGNQCSILGIGAIAPVNGIGFGQRCIRMYPLVEFV